MLFFVRINLVFFESHGYLGVRELREAYFDYIYGDLTNFVKNKTKYHFTPKSPKRTKGITVVEQFGNKFPCGEIFEIYDWRAFKEC